MNKATLQTEAFPSTKKPLIAPKEERTNRGKRHTPQRPKKGEPRIQPLNNHQCVIFTTKMLYLRIYAETYPKKIAECLIHF